MKYKWNQQLDRLVVAKDDHRHWMVGLKKHTTQSFYIATTITNLYWPVRLFSLPRTLLSTFTARYIFSGGGGGDGIGDVGDIRNFINMT